MWCFQPMPEPEQCATAVTWQSIPLGSATSTPYLSTNIAKKFILYRTLFDMVNSSYYLDLEDKRLLAWYFGVSNEDRKIIQEEGGLFPFLLNHPALDVDKRTGVVHVKPQIRKSAEEMAANKSRKPGACKTSCTPPSVVEKMCLGQMGEPTAKQSNPSENRDVLRIISAIEDPSAQVGICMDTGPEHPSKMAKGSSPPAHPVRKAQFGTVTDNRSHLDVQVGGPPEYYSFSSSPATLPASVDSLVSAIPECTENRAKPFPSETSAVSCRRRPSEWINLDAATDDGLQNGCKDAPVQSELWTNCSVTPEKPNASSSQKPHVDLPVKLGTENGQQTPWKEEESYTSLVKSGVHLPASAAAAAAPATVNQMVDASGDFRACFTSTQQCAAAPSTADVSTEMILPRCFDQESQTSQTSTMDKCVITEVYIEDLEYLTEEFMRLQTVEKDLMQLKANPLKPRMKCGCGCAEKLKQAELRLLALQYSTCQDHCWRRYYTSAHGEKQLHCPGVVPERLAETLQALEEDYSQLRRQVLSGATLDELSPLSVDTQRLSTEARYTPAQEVIEYVEGKAPIEQQAPLQLQDTTRDLQIHSAGEGSVCGNAVAHSSSAGVKSSTVLSLKNFDRSHGSVTPGGSVEGVKMTSETWYDAEEDLGSGGQTTRENPLRKGMKSERDAKDGDGVSSSCHLCVTDLHQDVTEEDLLLTFKKYHPKDVCLTVSSKWRSANMAVSSPESAELAVREVSGTPLRGRPIQVKRVCRPPAPGREGDHTFKKPHDPSAPEAAPSGSAAKPGSGKKSPPYNMSPRPLSCRNDELLNVSDVPTATGTFVPQQQPSASASTSTFTFGTLMRQLSERHPLLGKEKILEALLQLRAQYGGSLNCLSLDTLVEMISALITAQDPGSD